MYCGCTCVFTYMLIMFIMQCLDLLTLTKLTNCSGMYGLIFYTYKFHIELEAFIHWKNKKKRILFLLDCQVIWHALETSLEQKLSAGPSRYKEEESCSDIIAVVPRHVRILPLFFGFPQVRFCCYLFSIE